MGRDGKLLESRLLEAVNLARRQHQVDVALALAMIREALTRDRPLSQRQSYWPTEGSISPSPGDVLPHKTRQVVQ